MSAPFPPSRPNRKKSFASFFQKRSLLFLLISSCAHAQTLKISTWNLDWLTTRTRAEANLPADVHPRSPADFQRLAAYARKLNADVVAFQEVDGPQAAALVFDPARYTILTINEPVVQRVGIAVRRGIGITRNPDVAALDVEAGATFPLRDGLDVTLTLPGGQSLRVLVVHLKTGCQTDRLAGSTRSQCALFARQIPPLAAWAAARQREGTAFLLAGDFNRVLDDPEELAPPWPPPPPCRAQQKAAPIRAGTVPRSSITSWRAARRAAGWCRIACACRCFRKPTTRSGRICRTIVRSR